MLEILTTVSDAASGSFTIGDLMKILGWVTAFVSMVMGYVFHARAKAAEEKVKKLRVEEPVPTVPVTKVGGHAHYYQHEALVRRVDVLERDFADFEEKQSSQYVSLLEAGHARENAIKDKLDAQIRELHARLDDQFGPRPKKPGGGR